MNKLNDTFNAPYTSKSKGNLTNSSDENELYLYRKDEVRVPIHLKMTLTIREAAEYSNIGINKIDSMLKQPYKTATTLVVMGTVAVFPFVAICAKFRFLDFC